MPVPEAIPAEPTLERFVERFAALTRGRRIVALTGAGCSTESGIPDYRGEGTRRRSRSPVRFQVYLRDELARRRYWARSVIGYARVAAARPNPAHRALAALERRGALTGLITQNVDGLHSAAGSERVLELHGSLAEVQCLRCAAREPRRALQDRLIAMNPRWLERLAAATARDGPRGRAVEQAPDGDALVPDALISEFRVAECARCDGPLKPRVVFFGESVPRPTVEAAYELLHAADALLVVGSSLAVFSGYRFVKRAHARAQPIAMINLGTSRGDALVTLRVEARAGLAVPALARALGCSPDDPDAFLVTPASARPS